MDIALLAGITIPVTTRPFVITHPPTIPGLAAPTMSIAGAVVSIWVPVSATAPTATELGRITARHSTDGSIPVTIAVPVPTLTAITPQVPPMVSITVHSTLSELTVRLVVAILARHPTQTTVSPTVPGVVMMVPSTGEQRPVLTVATAPMSTPAIRSLTVVGLPSPILSTAGRQAAPAVTVPRKRQTIPLPTVHGLLFRTRNTVEARPVPAVTAAQKRGPIQMQITMAPVTIAAT